MKTSSRVRVRGVIPNLFLIWTRVNEPGKAKGFNLFVKRAGRIRKNF